eukprot:Colp12_sorted_trinity150504_noHs@33764
MALSEEEVSNQIKHMVAFISQEAQEKANEIAVKAQEEFTIEKGKLVQNEKLKLQTLYQRKEKQVAVQRKIAYSNELNQCRLQVLKAREQNVSAVVAEAQSRLTSVTKDAAKYKTLLEGLVAQVLLKLLEDTVVIRCREADVALVESAIPGAIKIYKDTYKPKNDPKVTVDKKSFLPANAAGGIEGLTANGNIKCINSLEARLENAARTLLPDIRVILYGPTPTRKFFD